MDLNPISLGDLTRRGEKTENTQRECHMMVEAGLGMMLQYAKGYKELLATLEAEERQRTSSLESSETAWFCWHLLASRT